MSQSGLHFPSQRGNIIYGWVGWGVKREGVFVLFSAPRMRRKSDGTLQFALTLTVQRPGGFLRFQTYSRLPEYFTKNKYLFIVRDGREAITSPSMAASLIKLAPWILGINVTQLDLREKSNAIWGFLCFPHTSAASNNACSFAAFCKNCFPVCIISSCIESVHVMCFGLW